MGYHNSRYQLDYQHHESKNCKAHYTDQYGLHWLGTYQSILPTMFPIAALLGPASLLIALQISQKSTMSVQSITDVRYHRTLQMMTYMETTPQYQLWVSSMYSDEDSTDC